MQFFNSSSSSRLSLMSFSCDLPQAPQNDFLSILIFLPAADQFDEYFKELWKSSQSHNKSSNWQPVALNDAFQVPGRRQVQKSVPICLQICYNLYCVTYKIDLTQPFNTRLKVCFSISSNTYLSTSTTKYLHTLQKLAIHTIIVWMKSFKKMFCHEIIWYNSKND